MHGSLQYDGKALERSGALVDIVNRDLLNNNKITKLCFQKLENGTDCMDFLIRMMDEHIREDNADLELEHSSTRSSFRRIALKYLIEQLHDLSLDRDLHEKMIELGLDEWDKKFIKLIQFIRNPATESELLCKEIENVITDLKASDSSSPEDLFSLTKKTRFWRLVKCAFDYSIFIELKNDKNITYRVKNLDDFLNAELDKIFKYEQAGNQVHKSEKKEHLLYCILNDSGNKAWNANICQHKYEAIKSIDLFDNILVIGNGSREIDQSSAYDCISALGNMIEKNRANYIIVECNYHGCSSPEDPYATLEKALLHQLHCMDLPGLDKASKQITFLVLVNSCFSGRLHKYNKDNNTKNNKVYLITSSSSQETSNGLDMDTTNRITALAQYLKEESQSGEQSLFRSLLKGFTRFYSEFKHSKPCISGPDIPEQLVEEYRSSQK